MAQNNEDKTVKRDVQSGPEIPEGAGGAEKGDAGQGGAQERPGGRKVIRKIVGSQPVKKKKIIIVKGNNNAGPGGSQRPAGSYSSGQRNGYGQDRRGSASRSGGAGGSRGGSSYGQAGGASTYRPIKPRTAPSQMSGDYHKPIPRSTQPARPREPLAEEQMQEMAVPVQEPVQEQVPLTKDTQAAQRADMSGMDVRSPQSSETAPSSDNVRMEGTAPQDAGAERPPRQEMPAGNTESAGNTEPARSDVPRGGAAGTAALQTGQGARYAAGRGRQGRESQGLQEHTAGSGGQSRSYGTGQTDRGRGQGRSYGQGAGQAGGQSRSYSAGQTDRSRGQGRSYGQGGGQGTGQGRPYGTGQGSRPGQGGRSGQGQGRSFGTGQGGRGGASSGSRGGQEFAAAGQGKRRNAGGASRDRHNRKDTAFEQSEQRERHSRSGRFIRPVVDQVQEQEEQIKVITIPEKLTIGALAEAMHLKPAELIKKLFLAGKAMTVNSEVSYDEAENIAADYDILCEKEEKVDVIQELLKEDDDAEESLVPRPPVICVMGHVDHGKTSILDYIRKTRVTEKEAGGITQAIGAYTVEVQDRMITFLDTPGHEAFTAMRLRGAKSTDIAVLVIAADDGVMPQTIEAINHAKAAGVEIIVALNKIDKPDADPEKVRQQLTKYELVPTDWGGSTEFVNVSAKTGEGIDELLETILLQADVMELKANPDRLARGLVLEARLDRGRGPVANVLVQKGTLHIGDFISAGPAFGRVRAMINDKGENVRKAGPSEPVMVLGLSDVPGAGEVLVGHPTNDEAKSYAQTYKAQHKEELVEENVMSMNVEDLFDQMREGRMKELGLIVKADVQGSVEALCASLLKLSNEEVKVRIIHSAAGAITESDVDLAAASNAAIIGFNVAPNSIAKSNAEHNGVSIHLYKVIYQAIDDVDAALKGMLAPVYEEKVTGHAEVRQLFRSGKIGNIAGCMVLDGLVERDASVRVTRGGEKLFEGELASLKRFKDDVKEVRAGYDCGLVFRGYDSMQEGDQIECYRMVEVPREEVIARREREAAKEAR